MSISHPTLPVCSILLLIQTEELNRSVNIVSLQCLVIFCHVVISDSPLNVELKLILEDLIPSLEYFWFCNAFCGVRLAFPFSFFLSSFPFSLTSCFCLFGISAITVAKEWPTGWGLNCTLWSTHLSKIIVFRRIKLSTILCMELWYCLTCIHFKLFHKDLALASPVNWCSGVRFFLFVI